MRGIRVIVGRRQRVPYEELQAVVFDATQWALRDVRSWMQQHGFDLRALVRSQGVYRYAVRDKRDFVPRSLRTISLNRWEQVTMASNPKRRGKKRRASKRRARNASRRRKVSARSSTRTRVRKNARRRLRRRRNPKTVRTDVRTVKVMRTNARKRRARPRRAVRSSTRYTLAFTPAAARLFARMLKKARRREMRRSLRRHPSGGVYVALPTWHGSREQANRFAAHARLVLTYAAGRRHAPLTSSAAPRVVAVP